MSKSGYPFPRSIDPSLIENGDTIKVTLPKSRGLEVSHTGTVHHRSDHGRTRYLYTEEGATLLSWEPQGGKRVHVLLLHRPEAAQQPLPMFEIPQEIEERMSA
jgi:hypothetical protein